MKEKDHIENPDAVRWYVMRAYKCEALAEEKLLGRQMEYFIPKQTVVRTYHGVKHRKLMPAIPSLVFVRASRRDLLEFKKGWNRLQFVLFPAGGSADYMVVRDAEMDNFIKAATCLGEDIAYFRPDEIDLKLGTRVRILGGRFDGVQGMFMRVGGRRRNRVVVALDGIVALTVDVRPDLVEVIE